MNDFSILYIGDWDQTYKKSIIEETREIFGESISVFWYEKSQICKSNVEEKLQLSELLSVDNIVVISELVSIRECLKEEIRKIISTNSAELILLENNLFDMKSADIVRKEDRLFSITRNFIISANLLKKIIDLKSTKIDWGLAATLLAEKFASIEIRNLIGKKNKENYNINELYLDTYEVVKQERDIPNKNNQYYINRYLEDIVDELGTVFHTYKYKEKISYIESIVYGRPNEWGWLSFDTLFYENIDLLECIKGLECVAKFYVQKEKIGRDIEYSIEIPRRNKAEEPIVSVIIPVYNVELYIENTLDAVLQQTLKNIEVICIDDGSIDNSSQIIRHKAELDNRIILLQQENARQSTARNHGLDYAIGQYVYFLDADDIIVPRTLEILVDKIKQSDAEMVLFDACNFRDDITHQEFDNISTNEFIRKKMYDGVYSGVELYSEMRKNRDYTVSPVLYLTKRSFIEDKKIRFFNGIIFEDNIYTFMAITQAPKVVYLPLQLYRRRVHEGSTMTNKSTFFHVYCYYCCYRETIRFLENCDISDEYEDVIQANIEGLIWNMQNEYSLLEEKEKMSINILHPEEKFRVRQLLKA